MFDERAKGCDRCCLDIGHHLYGVRIPHRHGCDLDKGVADLQRLHNFTAVAHERDMRRFEDGSAHVHRHAAVVFQARRDEAALGFHHDLAFVGQFLVVHEAHEATRTIATLLHLASIGIEDAITKVSVFVLRPFDQQQLVATDTEVAVGDETDVLRRQGDLLAHAIYHDEIVAGAVHLGEFKCHDFCCSVECRDYTVFILTTGCGRDTCTYPSPR